MSNPSLSFDWNQMRAFLATVEAGSLSAAARALGLTQPTLSRQIAALEADLGLLLFERVGRRLALTESGRLLLDHVKLMGTAADRISIAASSQSQAVEGVVRITAIDIIAGHVLPPILRELHAVAPGIEAEILASNSIDDLMRRQADIAIRHLRPEQDELVARRCPDTEIRLYAATALLDRIGRPARPEDLAEAPFVGFARDDEIVEQLNRRGVPVTRANFRWLCTSSLVGLEMIRQGLGIGFTFAAAADAMPELESVLPEIEPLSAPVWLVAHRELQTSRRIRIAFDVLAEGLERGQEKLQTFPVRPHVKPSD